MDKKSVDKNEYPDISGIFDIDENSLPKELMEKEKRKRDRRQKPILISEDSEKRMAKEREKELKAAHKKQRKKEKAKKKVRQITAAVLAGVLIVFAAAASIKGFFNAKNAPEVALGYVQSGEISVSHMSHALMLLSDTGSLYAAFVDNDFDLHSLENGRAAIITSADERTFVGQISSIHSEEIGSEITSRIQTMIPNGIYSSASNYVVCVTPAQSITGINENDTVTVETVIAYAADALIIPSAALFSDENGDFVWQYSSFTHKVKKVYVTAGINNGVNAQIKDGLRENAAIAYSTNGEALTLSDNQRVKIS